MNSEVIDYRDLDYSTLQVTSQARGNLLFNAVRSQIQQSQPHLYKNFTLTTKYPEAITRDGAERLQDTGVVRGITDPFQLSRLHNRALLSQNYNDVVRGTFIGEKYAKLKLSLIHI